MHLNRYRVSIPFREPTFEQRIGRPPSSPPFMARYEVVAHSPQDAQDRALEIFHEMASRSGVGWIREPMEAEIRVEAFSLDSSLRDPPGIA
jgi:hypothetical protein